MIKITEENRRNESDLRRTYDLNSRKGSTGKSRLYLRMPTRQSFSIAPICSTLVVLVSDSFLTIRKRPL